LIQLVTDQQLYLTIGIPTAAVLMGMLVNIGCFVSLMHRLDRFVARLDSRNRRA